MKKLMKFALHVVLLFVFALTGCSGGGGEVIVPGSPAGQPACAESGNATTGLWGLWQISIDKATGEFSITRLREADLALNVLGFMEPPVLVNMGIDWDTLILEPTNNYIGVDVILKHPFITSEHTFHGFDVRGIVFGPRLENADGLTRYFNPDEFTGMTFGYQDGLLGVPDSSANYSKDYNGYKYFADDIDLDETVEEYFSDPGNLANRGMFSEGSTNSRHYDLRFGDDNTDFLVFNYAICASYNWPEGEPPFELDDFNINTANQAEPVFVEVTEVANSLCYDGTGGGGITLDLTIFDWVKPVTEEVVFIEAPGVIAQTAATFVSDVDGNRRLYSVTAAGTPTSTDDLEILISVTTEKTYGEHYFMGLLPGSHLLYDEGIEVFFIHSATVSDTCMPSVLYDDPMDTTTEGDWTIEHGANHFATTLDWNQAGTEWQTRDGGTGEYENDMDTYLVSPLINAPSNGVFTLELTHRYSTEWDYDLCHVRIREESGSWMMFSPDSTALSEMSADWPGNTVEMFSANITPDANFQLGFHFFSDSWNQEYPGWFIDHVRLISQAAPQVGPVQGMAITGHGNQTYSVSVNEPNGDGYTYNWEIGDDDPPEYDDGPGNGAGSIDINWSMDGLYIIGCKVTDNGSPALSGISNLWVWVDSNAPATAGPIEDFDSWPPSGWSFNDHTTAVTGQFWGQTNAMSKNCLDADGADDSCYTWDLFEEARWENVTVPSSSNAILAITHAIDSECWAYPDEVPPEFYCYDGGMLFIDDQLIYDDDCLGGLANGYYHDIPAYWTSNTFLPTWPGDTSNYFWSWMHPAPFLSGFALSVMDISDYADGGQHDFSFVFHSDDLYACEDGTYSYHTWLIDKVEIFYD